MKDNVLIVGDYNRQDFLYVAQVIHKDFNVYFLEYTHKDEIITDHYKKWGQAIFWGDYNDAFNLLEVIKPKWVLFYFIESFNHVALNVTCKYKGVKTYHMEHGIRSYELLQSNINQVTAQNINPFDVLKKLKNFKSRIKSRLFFQKSVERLPAHYKRFLVEYFKIRGSNSIFETFKKISNPLRVADCYISFSPKIFEFHQQSDHLEKDYPVFFIGCPAFDYLHTFAHLQKHGEDILFIDQAFETQDLFGWNNENKIRFLDELIALALDQKRKVWIKIHPYSNKTIYQNCSKNDNVRIIKNEKDFKESILNTCIVIGFNSTLLMPLMAFEHTICFSLEMHPHKFDYKLSSFLVNTGAIQEINSWEELRLAFKDLQKIFVEQKKYKLPFVEQWMYRFDGKSSEILKNILLSEIS